MAIYNPLSWQNEHGLSNYPLASSLDIPDFIVDAKFVQFDNFIPVLNTVTVDAEQIKLAITFDYGEHTELVFLKSEYDKGEAYRSIRMYVSDTTRGDLHRYLGVITFGPGTNTLWSSAYTGRVLNYNISFLPETVRGIPSQDAVYLFDGNYGDVVLGRTSTDTSIFYNTYTINTLNIADTDLNSITFNAVEGHSVDGRTPEGLSKINLVKPVDNNITLASNDVIKISSPGGITNTLKIDLVSGSASQAFVVPTLTG